MDIATVREFFMWCTIVNAALLLLSLLVCVSARDWIYRIHARWFPMSREAFNVTLYAFLGAYKLIFWGFSATPYIALLIMG